MSEFLSFLKEHWRILAEIVLALALLLVTLLQKKVKVIDVIKTVISEALPDAINQAEIKYPGHGEGEVKKAYTVQLICAYVAQKYGIAQYEVFNKYHKFIEESLENILSTPTKKER